MLDINILADEELKNTIDIFISGMLPHANYNADNFPSILKNTLSYIKLEEFSMEYYVLLKALSELNKIKISSTNYKPVMERSIFSHIVEVSVEDLITNPSIKIKQYLDYEGLNSNLAIQTTKELAMQKIYSRSMELYDRCMELKYSSDKVENYLPAYREAFIAHVGIQSIQAQNAIITGTLQVGRKVYSGFSDWLEYSKMMSTEIATRLEEVENMSSMTLVDSLEKVDRMGKELKESFIPIALWGIPELDGDGIEAGTPILRHRLVVVVGSVNIGKSMFCKDTATTVLLSEKRVRYMYGEGAEAGVWGDLLVNYIYKKFGKYVTVPMLTQEEEQPEEIQRIIKLAKAEIYTSGNLGLRKAYHYDNLYDELVADYKESPFDLLILDHSLALEASGKKTDKENVDALAVACRNFKREYPVCILIASHPSSAAKEYLAKDKRVPSDIAATRDSSTLEAEADELFILRDNEILEKQNLIALENKKRRNAPVLRENVILNKQFDVCHFGYDPTQQSTSAKDTTNAEQALLELQEAYDEDDEYYNL